MPDAMFFAPITLSFYNYNPISVIEENWQIIRVVTTSYITPNRPENVTALETDQTDKVSRQDEVCPRRDLLGPALLLRLRQGL